MDTISITILPRYKLFNHPTDGWRIRDEWNHEHILAVSGDFVRFDNYKEAAIELNRLNGEHFQFMKDFILDNAATVEIQLALF